MRTSSNRLWAALRRWIEADRPHEIQVVRNISDEGDELTENDPGIDPLGVHGEAGPVTVYRDLVVHDQVVYPDASQSLDAVGDSA